MKFEGFMPDEFIDEVLKLDDPECLKYKNTDYNDYYYATINLINKIITDYLADKIPFIVSGKLSEPYIRHKE